MSSLCANSWKLHLSRPLNYLNWKSMERIGSSSAMKNQSFPCSFLRVAISERKQPTGTCADIGHFARLFQGHNHTKQSLSNSRHVPCVLCFSPFLASPSTPRLTFWRQPQHKNVLFACSCRKQHTMLQLSHCFLSNLSFRPSPELPTIDGKSCWQPHLLLRAITILFPPIPLAVAASPLYWALGNCSPAEMTPHSSWFKAKFNILHPIQVGLCVSERTSTGGVKTVACRICTVFGRQAHDGISITSCCKRDDHKYSGAFRCDKYRQHLLEMYAER